MSATCSLSKYVDIVLLARDITAEYASKVRYCNRRFIEWLGKEPTISELECQSVNAFLTYLKEIGKKPDTVAGYRRAILVVWYQAFYDGHTEIPPLRVRKIRTPRDPVEAFTHNEILALVEAAKQEKGYFPNGVKAATFWVAAIHAAYSTGLRRGDLLRLKRSQITDDGVCHVRQNKTGYRITVRLSEEALAAVNAMRSVESELALPWPYHENVISRQFRRIVKRAGVRQGQFRWLRRSAGSYAESEERGNGKVVLGHRSEKVFHDFYEDPSITVTAPIVPPAIKQGRGRPKKQ